MEEKEVKEVKDEEKVEVKENKKTKDAKEGSMAIVWAFIKEEHKFENWLLFALALILLVLALYILLAGIGNAMGDEGTVNPFADAYFDISLSGWWIFNKPWKVILISSIIIVLSVASIVYCVWPVCVPSFKELKFVTWTDKKTLFVNSLTVVCFIAFLTVLFFLFNLALAPLFNLMFGA